ncbi:HSPB1-associated protein 1-like isoform X2 [Rhopilema esculentum]|uniref:HSPB1-associated protein 1-like isoform X2 n=1 Tax=Rhopilema esculentum TaxID=499914 RepID=UPI0031D47DBD
MAGNEGGHQRVEIVGKQEPSAAIKLIYESQKPFVFKGMIDHWKASQWTVGYFCRNFGDLPTTFKVCPIHTVDGSDTKKPVMETECVYIEGTFADFIHWLRGDYGKCASLRQFPRDIDWGTFGFEGRDGRDSSIWIGSYKAFTPLHKDTYGLNLVAQLSGKKSWTLFPPKDTLKVYPTRIPYEESSVFSEVNIKSPDFVKHPEFKDATGYKAILEAGDVLCVPKHWWHFVENIEPSVSVNTWIEKESDHFDRLKEALVRLIVTSMKESQNCSQISWLNPNEVAHPHVINVGYVKHALQSIITNATNSDEQEQHQTISINTDSILNCLVSDRVVNAVVDELVSKYNIPTG